MLHTLDANEVSFGNVFISKDHSELERNSISVQGSPSLVKGVELLFNLRAVCMLQEPILQRFVGSNPTPCTNHFRRIKAGC
jgi:hypothetical protein